VALTEREKKMPTENYVIPLERIESFNNILKDFKTLKLNENDSITEFGLYSFSGSRKELNLLGQIELKYDVEIWPELIFGHKF